MNSDFRVGGVAPTFRLSEEFVVYHRLHGRRLFSVFEGMNKVFQCFDNAASSSGGVHVCVELIHCLKTRQNSFSLTLLFPLTF